MARTAQGTFELRTLADGSAAFHLRFRAQGRRRLVVLHARRGCTCGCGGGWDEAAARNELGNILARVRVGIWKPPAPPPALATSTDVPTFHEYASRWLQAKVDGVIGDKPIAPSTAADYRWRLRVHLLPFFAAYRLDEIDRRLCLAFKAYKLRESRELQAALADGADIRDHRGRRAVPLAPASLRKLIDGLAAILDDAVEDQHIAHNPARGKRMRVRVPKPTRSFLEMDELAALLDAAAAQEVPLPTTVSGAEVGPTTAMVGALLRKGLRPTHVAQQLGLAKSTVSWHVTRLNAQVGRGYIGRRVVCEILARSGVRASELCNMRIGHVRVHDRDGARFRIPDSKTETGIREVQMSPDLVEAVIEHVDWLRRIGRPVGPEDWLVPNLRGNRLDRQRVGSIVTDAAQYATVRRGALGLPPLPATTPHSLRRTYISVALLANNFDVKWVMSQVGHADSKMTLDVYAQLEQRADRSHGTSFDRLVRAARQLTSGPVLDSNSAPGSVAETLPIGRRKGDGGETAPERDRNALKPEPTNQGDLQEEDEMARPGLEPGTPRFSVVCSTN
jgi:integrase